MTDLVEKVEKIVEDLFDANTDKFDLYHTLRVKAVAESLALEERDVDVEVVSLASLLHDIANEKYYSDEKEGIKKVSAILREAGAKPSLIAHVIDIVSNIFFKGAGVQTPMKTIEGKIVQDAERLDSMGAIGIVRCFMEGLSNNREMYNTDYVPQRHVSKEAYNNSKTDSLNHFHEKLYYLKDSMNTLAGKRLAAKRHKFMKKFEQQFRLEWFANDLDPILQKIRAKSPWQDPYFLHYFSLMVAAIKDPVKFEKMHMDEYDISTPEKEKDKNK